MPAKPGEVLAGKGQVTFDKDNEGSSKGGEGQESREGVTRMFPGPGTR